MSFGGIRTRRLFNLIFIVIGLGLLVSGCSSSVRGYQKALDFKDYLPPEPKCVNGNPTEIKGSTPVNNGSTPVNKECRNKYIDYFIIQSSINFSEFVRALTSEKNTSGLIIDNLRTGLDAAIVVVTGAGPKTALGAASLGLAGLQGSIDKRLFYEKTVPALIKFMDAKRYKILTEITERRAQDISTYPLYLAMEDIRRLNDAGSITDAINSVAAEGAKQAEEAEKELSDVIKFKGAPASRSLSDKFEILTNYLSDQIQGSDSSPTDDLKKYAVAVDVDPSGKEAAAIIKEIKNKIVLVRSDEDFEVFVKPMTEGVLSSHKNAFEAFTRKYEYYQDLRGYIDQQALADKPFDLVFNKAGECVGFSYDQNAEDPFGSNLKALKAKILKANLNDIFPKCQDALNGLKKK